jgi:hypothetical protein
MERHTIPRLNVPDFIFSFAGFDISVRQFLLVILGFLLCLNFWQVLDVLGDETSVFRWAVVSLPLLIALIFGWVRVGGRPLEERLLVMVRYYTQPRLYLYVPRRSENRETRVSIKTEEKVYVHKAS